jgi:cytochrome bd-type quinol oxidase subunit 2
MKKLIVIVGMVLMIQLTGSFYAVAQNPETDRVEMADVFRQDGKIYVVVAIIGVVLAGLIIYTIRIDQRVQRLEEEFKNIPTQELEV